MAETSFRLTAEKPAAETSFKVSPPSNAALQSDIVPGPLANSADDSDAMRAAKYAGTMLLRGGAQIPGMFGNLREGADALAAAIPASFNALFNNADFKQDYSRQIAGADAAREAAKPQGFGPLELLSRALPEPPSGHDIIGAIAKLTGQYTPETAPGRVGMATAEGLGASVVPGAPELGIARMANPAAVAPQVAARPYIANLIAGTAGGAGAQTAMEGTGNPLVALPAGAAASMSPQWLATAATGRTLSAAERMAGQTLRDASATPGDTVAALENMPTGHIPGVTLRAGQVARDPGLLELENRLAQKSKDEGTFKGEIAADQASNTAALETAADAAAAKYKKDPWTAANLSANSPEELSVTARNRFAAAEEAADKQQSAAWQVPEMEGMRMFKKQTLAKIRDTIDGLPEADKAVVSGMYTKILDQIDANLPGQIPMEEIQRLHSNMLADARAASLGATPNPNLGRVLGKVSESVRDALFDQKNYSHTKLGGLQAFEDAKAATADYYKKFGPLKDLLAEGTPGVEKVAPEATLNKLMRGDNSPQNVRLFRDAVGTDADETLSDHVVSTLTKHGDALPAPPQIERYMTDNAATIAEVPGLKDRLNALRTASREDLVSGGISKRADKPEKLLQYLDDNADDVNAVFKDPAQRDLIDAIRDTSRRLSKIPKGAAGEVGTMDTLNQITDGRILDVLLGSMSAKTLGISSGVGAAHIAHSLGIPYAEEAMGAAGLLGGLAHGTKYDVGGNLAATLLLGKNQDRVVDLLKEGLRDPAKAAFLMRKADPETMNVLFQRVAPNVQSTMPVLSESLQKNREANDKLDRAKAGLQ